MRRRFGRRRQSGAGDEGRASFDAARALERIEAAGSFGVRGLAPLAVEGLPPGYAAVGSGETESGERVLVAFAPHDAGDAILAALAAATGADGAEPFAGTVLAIAPTWSLLARRVLALVGETPFTLRAVEAPDLGEAAECVLPEPLEDAPWLSIQQLSAHLVRAADRELAERAMQGLAGLAAKHGGTIRTNGRSLELVLLARRVAAVRIDDDGVLLDTIHPARRSERLGADDLGDALDRLEGGLRKRLHDRSVRDGEDGLRTRAIPALASLLALRAVSPWPCGGADAEAIDLVGVDPEGHPVVGAIRDRLGLAALGPILDALIALRPALAGILAEALPPIRLETPRLALAAASLDAIVPRVVRWLALATTFVEVRRTGAREPELVLGEAVRSAAPAARRREERPARETRAGRGDGSAARPAARDGGRARELGPREPQREEGLRERSPRRVREAEPAGGGFEEVSLFDLDVAGESLGDDLASEGAAGRRRRRRRGRGRGRGRSENGERGERDNGNGSDEAERAPRATSELHERRAQAVGAPTARALDEEADEEPDLDESLVPLSPDAPEFVEELAASLEEEDDDEEADEEADPETERMHRERALRRRARVAKAAPPVVHEAPRERPQRPKRVAILAHADRDSLVAAVLLARDLRLLEGIWVYPQSELMTFFRGVATDLREETPIHVIGFSASPARDVLQAASLYRDRLVWYDHHAWPPEDVERLRAAIGSDAVHVSPGARSSLPVVLAQCGRRSRFSDKLVDLVFARFSHHDYERWGRVWWARLATIAERGGERRADLEPLLIGRPSDLAREAAAAQAPAPPAEVEFVAGQDFRLAHFSGHGLVVVPVPPTLDPNLAARIARERYGAALSLAFAEGDDTMVLAADELPGRRALDVVSMAEHLSAKHEWITALPDADHVARIAVRRLALHPERVDEVLAEIAMGRSILEG
ncbi:MAG: hypothetical protein IT386_02885 [Deltaproteobacteria bacterium]|nr:hypothetical protein [Deltaproteobacteria bacterium]